jgi:hypothetical protein
MVGAVLLSTASSSCVDWPSRREILGEQVSIVLTTRGVSVPSRSPVNPRRFTSAILGFSPRSNRSRNLETATDPATTNSVASSGFDDREGQVYPAPSQAGPGNDIHAGSPGLQKAPTRGPASLVAIRALMGRYTRRRKRASNLDNRSPKGWPDTTEQRFHCREGRRRRSGHQTWLYIATGLRIWLICQLISPRGQIS